MDRITVIQEIIKKINAQVYLEIGIRHGDCFLEIVAPKKIGVDPKILISPERKSENKWNVCNEYYEMTSDDFFKAKSDLLKQHGLDVIFVDGLHTHEQSLKDVNNSVKYLNDGGVIIMHDCNPSSKAAAWPANSYEHAEKLKLPGWIKRWNGDVWKTIVHLRSNRDDLNIFVLNCDFGLGIITKGKPGNALNYSVEEVKNLSYDVLKKNRRKMLNLKSQRYLKRFIEKLRPAS